MLNGGPVRVAAVIIAAVLSLTAAGCGPIPGRAAGPFGERSITIPAGSADRGWRRPARRLGVESAEADGWTVVTRHPVAGRECPDLAAGRS